MAAFHWFSVAELPEEVSVKVPAALSHAAAIFPVLALEVNNS